MYRPIPVLLLDAQVAIQNAQTSPKISATIAQYGYTSERLHQGNLLYDAAQQAHHHYQTTCGDQLAATQRVQQTRQQAQKSYRRFVKLARIAFKDDRGLYIRLGL